MKIDSTIYLDHQATTPVDPRVLDEMLPFFSIKFGNPHSSDHIMGWNSYKAIEKAKQYIAGMIESDPDEIIFTSGATESNNLFFSGLLPQIKKKGKILLSKIEHKSVIDAAFHYSQSIGCTVDLIPVNRHGIVDFQYIENIKADQIAAISIIAVNNEIGTIQDIERISSFAYDHGILCHIDAAQAPLALDLNVDDIHFDMISLSSHKIYGPKGIGAVYIKRNNQKLIVPLLHGGGQQNNLRSGTLPTPLCVGFGEAARIVKFTGYSERLAMLDLVQYLENQLQTLDCNVVRNSPPSNICHPCNLNVRFDGFDAQDILSASQPFLAASTGSACTSGYQEPSYVLRAIGLSEDEAKSSLRFSVGRYTTRENIDEAVSVLKISLDKLLETK
jgi:cysteine desulfurase